MAFTCIPKAAADAFKKALKGKDIQIADLLKMSTEERTKLFEKFAGDKAKSMNTLFEEKLVLKNKVAGLKNFINKTIQKGRYSPEKKAQLEQALSDFRAQQQERIFSPAEEQTFLNDLADKVLGTHITKFEAKNVFELTSKTEELLKNFDGEKWSSEKVGKEYGASKVILDKYVDSLKEGDKSIKELVHQAIADTKETWTTNKPRAVYELLMKTLKTVVDNSISTVATIDNSFMGRQGLKTLMTHPSAWWRGARSSFTDIAGEIGGKNMIDALMADIYSNPNYIKGRYDQAGILPKSEEQYPGSLTERVYGVGRVFKASEVAFKGSAIRIRTGLYDTISSLAEKNGVDVADKYQIESMGKLINSLTSRGQWGKTGEPTIVRMFMWAPKMLKGNIDVLTAHVGQDISPFARKQAVINLTKIIATSAGIMAMANAIKPGSAELDPRSSDFGKIRVGHTTFDFTGGAGSLIVLASRVATGESKSTTTGIIRKYGTAVGQTSAWDAIVDFLTSKTTPPVGAAISLLKGTTPTGEKATISNVAMKTVTPISIQNLIGLKDEASVQAILGVMLDVVGINTNTYVPGAADWTQSTSKEMDAFQKKVGDTKFIAANNEYNKKVTEWLLSVSKKPSYTSLSSEDKQRLVTAKKDKIKTEIFKQYGFRYISPVQKRLPKL